MTEPDAASADTAPRPAFDDYVRRRSEQLQRAAWLVTRHWDDARDAVQDALVALHPRWHTLPSEPGRFEAYVHRTTINAALGVIRRRGAQPVADPGSLPEAPAGPDPAASVADAETIWRWCADLPPTQRAAVVLRFHLDLTYADIADALDCRETTALSHVHRAVAALRERFTEEEGV